jgi:hypothetical protein
MLIVLFKDSTRFTIMHQSLPSMLSLVPSLVTSPDNSGIDILKGGKDSPGHNIMGRREKV